MTVSPTARQNLPPSLYPGANLDLTPGGNISALQEENDRVRQRRTPLLRA